MPPECPSCGVSLLPHRQCVIDNCPDPITVHVESYPDCVDECARHAEMMRRDRSELETEHRLGEVRS